MENSSNGLIVSGSISRTVVKLPFTEQEYREEINCENVEKTVSGIKVDLLDKLEEMKGGISAIESIEEVKVQDGILDKLLIMKQSIEEL